MSIGKYMWQIQSMQGEIADHYDRKVDRKTAILVAIDAYSEIPVDDITRKVLFTGKRGMEALVQLLEETWPS